MGIDVIRAQDDGTSEFDDRALLDRATVLDRRLVTYDEDFLREAHRRRLARESFCGVIFANTNRTNLKQIIEDVTLVAECCTDHEIRNRVVFVPL